MNDAASPGTTAVAKFSNFLDKFKPQLKLALPSHLNADRMSRLALTAFSTNLALQECTPKSIAASIMLAGQLGLEIGVNGAGFLIPYKGTCTFVPGWKGLVDLVARSGRGTVFTGVIYKDQEYTYTDGAKRDLVIHNESELDGADDITHTYAIGWVKGAAMPIIELWRISKLERHRDKYNKVGTKHYSFRDWEMYARKVPLLQVLKYMPCSVEVANAIAVSHAAEAGRAATIENGIVVDVGDQFEQATEAGQAEITGWPDDLFAKELPGWLALIAKKKKTAAEIIAMASSKYPLTEEQKKAIDAPAEKEPSLEEIKGICFAAIALKDKDVAYARLDDAKFIASRLPKAEKAEADKEIATAEAAIKARK